MEHRGLTFVLFIGTAQGVLKGRGYFSSQMNNCAVNINLCACQGVHLGASLLYVPACKTKCGSARYNDKESDVNTACKQNSLLFPVLFSLVDLRSAYPLSLLPNGQELRKQIRLLVHPKQQVTQNPRNTHSQDTCISSNLQFCCLASSLLSFSFTFSTKNHNPLTSQEA